MHLSVIPVHTNWDICVGGVNDPAGLIGLEPISSGWRRRRDGWMGFTVLTIPVKGTAPPPYPGKVASSCPGLLYPDTVSYPALAGGAGGELWPEAKSKGRRCSSADMKCHQVMEAVESNLGVMSWIMEKWRGSPSPPCPPVRDFPPEVSRSTSSFEAGNIETD